MQHSQSIIGMASNEYELASPVLTLKIEDAKKLIAKWVDRYHLLDTPQQTYRRRLNGEPVFSLSVYFYFNMPEDSVVFHMMGQPQETRHLVIRNEQAAISPSWSIHSGVGTVNYTFIWGMCGENQTFDDMDHVTMGALK